MGTHLIDNAQYKLTGIDSQIPVLGGATVSVKASSSGGAFVVAPGCIGHGLSCAACMHKNGVCPLLVLNSCESAEKVSTFKPVNVEALKHKKARFFVRAFRGVSCGLAKGFRFRWFVLTESDLAIADGVDFGPEFHKFITWLRYQCPDFQYLVVEHRQGDKKRRNWHVLSYGSDKLPVRAIRDYWLGHFKSTVTGMAEVADIQKAVKYLATYLAGDDSKSEKFIRCFASQGWVFRGWVGSCKAYKSKYGEYLPAGELVRLAGIVDKSDLAGELECLIESGVSLNEFYRLKNESSQGALRLQG